MFCPACGFTGPFKEYGKTKRANAMCPKCKSLERQRGMYLFIENMTKKALANILYISPPECFSSKLYDDPNLNYHTIDVDPNRSDVRYLMDVCRLAYPNSFFDLIICYDVLNKVKYDDKALIEMKRVLSASGTIILDSPHDMEKTKTNKISESDEKYYFKKGIEYRKYGKDLLIKMNILGFDADIIRFGDVIKPEQLIECNINPDDTILVCRRNTA